jgi:hypothetical protein
MTDIEEALRFNWGEAQLEPDNWFEVPEFNVMPADVDFQGFSRPIEHPGTKDHYLANSVRMLVRVARSLARARFGTQAALVAAGAEVWTAIAEGRTHVNDDKRIAFIYQLAMHDLHEVLEPPAHVTHADVLGRLASTGALIATWAHEGAAAAAQAMSERSERMREIASKPRAPVTVKAVAEFAARSGFPGKLTWQAFSNAACRALLTTPSTLRRRYDAASDAGLVAQRPNRRPKRGSGMS